MNECYAYISKALPELDPLKLSKIIVQSRGFNTVNDITGVLLYDGTHFYQYIEGPPDALRDARERIEQSRHHLDLRVLLDGTPRVPGAFPNWSLGYLFVDEAAQPLHGFVVPADHDAVIAAFAALTCHADVM